MQNQQQHHQGKQQEKEFVEKVIQVNRVSKKTKGGNQMGFSVLVVVGDKKGRVGAALGKAKDVSSSVQKAVKRAKRMLIRVPLQGTTIPFALTMKFGAAQIMMKPAPPGSGIISGGSVRAVFDAAGIRDISSKVLGTNNPVTNIYATIKALKTMNAMVARKNITLKTVEQQEQKEKRELRETTKVETKEPAKKVEAVQPAQPAVKPEVKAAKKPAAVEAKTKTAEKPVAKAKPAKKEKKSTT